MDYLEKLEKDWLDAKSQEDAAKQRRLEIEGNILDELVTKEQGTIPVAKAVKVTTGYNREWDQDGLKKLAEQDMIPAAMFDSVFKEKRSNTKALEESAPQIWNERFRPLLTLKPKKPSFQEAK